MKTPQQIAVWLSIISCCLLPGCALRSIYIPVSQNVPLFDSTKALRANLYPGANHLELQGAVHPTKHFSIAANINFGTGISIYDLALGHSVWKGRWRWECFAGFGYNTNVIYPGSNDPSIFSSRDIDYELRSLYQKYYLQPAIGFTGSMRAYRINYSFALSTRISALHFNEYLYRTIDKVRTTNPDQPVYVIDKRYLGKMLYTLEPCITNRVARGQLYALLQAQAMIPYSEAIDVRNTKFSPGVLLSIGIGYELPLGRKKKVWE